ncbi:hypothetical protein PoB_005960600 [Plakobranchus ocellatus]|uniref:Bestrophin homolog n=1 Tax=Plakobranchus ocellatus TaxID=259542 RepID=A0AAV4CCQ5_9GAST|nr:hypothetical protein PoB_005960600 [Plakobranchus ocellatus]
MGFLWIGLSHRLLITVGKILRMLGQEIKNYQVLLQPWVIEVASALCVDLIRSGIRSQRAARELEDQESTVMPMLCWCLTTDVIIRTDVAVTVRYPPISKLDNFLNEPGLVVWVATVSRIMRGHVMAPHFSLSNGTADVRPGCKTQRIAPTLQHDESHSRLAVLSHQRNRVFSNMYSWTRELLPSA